jgi:hypothetical protein
MPTTQLGPGVSRYIDDQDRQYAIVTFQANRPPLDSELNLIQLIDLESKAELIRSRYPSGWLLNESNPRADFTTNVNYSNLFFFGRNFSGETRDPAYAIVNGWLIPVTGTKTGSPPLAPNNTDTWNKILLNPPSTSTGGNRAEFVFLEVWLMRIDVDPASPGIAPGKPQRGFIYRFGNTECGFSNLPDDMVDPAIGFETTERVQIQYRIRVVADINLAQYSEGFDPTLVFAQGALSTPSAIAFQNMRGNLGDPGLWRAGTGDPTTFGTVDGYVYAVPISAVFRRNGAGFSDTGNLAGAFNRNSLATNRSGAAIYSANPVTPTPDMTETTTLLTFSSISGTILATINSFGEAFFRIDEEIIRVTNIVQVGAIFQVTVDRGQLGTTIRTHKTGTTMVPYTVRPDGLFADQITATDILDLRHSVADRFDYDSILKTNFTALAKSNLRTAWKRYGSTNSSGPIILYGDRVTDSSTFVGGLTRLDGPNGNRRVYSDSIVTERYCVPVIPPSVSAAIGSPLQIGVVPYQIPVTFTTAAPGHPAANPARQSPTGIGPVYWFNGDQITINKSAFLVGMPASDADQVRFVLPTDDSDSVIIHFEGMTTDPNGGTPALSGTPVTSPTASNPVLSVARVGNRILKNGQGITVALDGSGNLVITLASGTLGNPLQEFADAIQGSVDPIFVGGFPMQIEFSVIYGAGRGLSHKPDFVHTVQWRGTPTNTSKVILRPGLIDRNRMVPTFLPDSPYIQTGRNRTLARTSEVMVDPGSKTAWIAPYRNVLIPPLLARNGYAASIVDPGVNPAGPLGGLNWFGAVYPLSVQGAMPLLSQNGSTTVHSIVDPLDLFYDGAETRYVEIPWDYLPRPGLHHTPIVPITNTVFPSGINFFFMSKEGPMPPGNTSDYNRNLVSYPAAAGYYIVTPEPGVIPPQIYGTASGTLSIYGQKYTNDSISSSFGGPWRGIQFPPFLAPARITGVYLRDNSGGSPQPVVPSPPSPFNTDRVLGPTVGKSVNLLRDDFDGATFLLNVDSNGDLTFVLAADAIDLNKAPPGTTFDNREFLIECTLFAFDRGFLQTNGRILVAKTSAGGSIAIAVDTTTVSTDTKVGCIFPSPMTNGATNNEITFYYSHEPYQGDVFGTQNAYSDDVYRLGPLTVGEAQSIAANPLGPVDTLAFPNPFGFEVLASMSFSTSLGSGRLSGSVPIPRLESIDNPGAPPDYSGTLDDVARKFSLNRVGYEDWETPKFPVYQASLAARPQMLLNAISEVYDDDVHPEFAGCTSNLPVGIWLRDKDFIGKTLYQNRSASDLAAIQHGSFSFIEFEAPMSPAPAGTSTWEGTEFICGHSSGVAGVGDEAMMTVDGTSNVSDNTKFKTTRGGAGWSISDPYPGGPVASRFPKLRPNKNVGSVLVGNAYLVRSQPETVGGSEIHPGNELQMIVVTEGIPTYFSDTEVVHSANGTNEGYTALDRFRILGRPLEKRRGQIDITVLPSSKPLFTNMITTDPILFGSSDVPLVTPLQITLPVTVNGQTLFNLPNRPLDPTTVLMFVNGVKIDYGTNYTVGGPYNLVVTYIVSGSNPALITTDQIELWYILL